KRGDTSVGGVHRAARLPADRQPVLIDPVQVWAEASFDEEFAGFAATIFESLVEEFTVYLASYLHEARGAGLESARDRAEELVPAILAMIQGAVVQSAIFCDRSRQGGRAGIEGLLSRIDY